MNLYWKYGLPLCSHSFYFFCIFFITYSCLKRKAIGNIHCKLKKQSIIKASSIIGFYKMCWFKCWPLLKFHQSVLFDWQYAVYFLEIGNGILNIGFGWWTNGNSVQVFVFVNQTWAGVFHCLHQWTWADALIVENNQVARCGLCLSGGDCFSRLRRFAWALTGAEQGGE